MEINDTIRIAERENFHLIPIIENDKRPIWKKWQEIRLHLDILPWITDSFNLAVVAEELFILDFDNRLPGNELYISIARSLNTLICFTPRGFHAYYQGSYPLNLKPETIRHGKMYALIPPSKINEKSYWWLDHGRNPILDMSKVR